ncbi:MAG: family transposase [Thermodesulfobacteriota bacterium]|nr:family transposase [Thermodesulfobacteriota bacterium]
MPLRIAVSAYVLVTITKKQLNMQAGLPTMLQVASVSAFERTLLLQLLTQHDHTTEQIENDNQLVRFN